MIILNDSHFIGYFGDKNDNLLSSPHEKLQKKLIHIDPFFRFLFFPKQTHSDIVRVVSQIDESSVFECEADAVITQLKHVGIGIVTADCVPLLLLDSKKQAIGAVHAGWKGLSKKIITKTIEAMKNEFGTCISDIQFYMGPSACVCCYEVQSDLRSHFPSSAFEQKKAEKLFLNFKEAISIELIQKGISKNKINTTHNCCTICESNFCSFRREKNQAGRQPSIAILM